MTTTKSAPVGIQARKASRKPVTLAPVALAPTPTGQQALAALAQALAPAATYTALPTPAAPSTVPAPVAPVGSALPPVAVALRGGLAVVAVAPGKPYRVQAGHNLTWLQQVQAVWAVGGNVAAVQALLVAGVPAPFVGYMVRRGYAIPCTLPAPATLT